MNKVMDKLFNLIKFDKRYVFFNLIIVLMGIIFGSLFIVILSKSDRSLIIEYITEFTNNIKNNNFNYNETLINTILINLLIVTSMVIFGISCILVPINILMLFYKSFIIGFSISGFILSFKIKGLLLGLIYIFPHLVFNIFIFSILTAFTLKLTVNLIKNTLKKKKINLRLYMQKYLFALFLFLILISISSLYESFIMPYVLKKILTII